MRQKEVSHKGDVLLRGLHHYSHGPTVTSRTSKCSLIETLYKAVKETTGKDMILVRSPLKMIERPISTMLVLVLTFVSIF